MTLQEKINEYKSSYRENIHFYHQQEQNAKTDYDRVWNNTAKLCYAGILNHIAFIKTQNQIEKLIGYYKEVYQDALLTKHTMENLVQNKKTEKNYEKLAVANAEVQFFNLFIRQLNNLLKPQNLKGQKTNIPKSNKQKLVCVEKMF